MKLTESMLRDFVTTSLTAEQIGDLLTMTGFELEGIEVVDGEKVLDVNIMANRGDGASVLGLARELLAKDPTAKATPLCQNLLEGLVRGDESEPTAQSKATVRIETPDCTRYACRVFEGVQNGPSPEWVQERLHKLGQRPISLLVDLTNYVMLETGQPLHAFDLEKIKGSTIVVRQANPGEKMTTLDGTEHQLTSTNMMICDVEGPVAVAGVMGGEDTEVSSRTTRCLLESAHFDHQSVRKTRKALGLQTDASYRFERYVDPEGVVRALNRFTELLLQASGADAAPGVIDVYPTKPVRTPVRVRTERCNLLLGMPVTSDEIERYLDDLSFIVVRNGDSFTVTPPSWRIDLEREDDFVEEVGRIHGYEKIPETMLIGSTPVGGTKGQEALVDRIREELLKCGLHQTISHSLRDAHPLDADTERVRVRNPHSPEMSFLRNSNLPCLAEAAVRNGTKDVHVFEIGHVFSPGRETVQLGILSNGGLDPVFWQKGEPVRADFFSVKGVLGRIHAATHVEFEPTEPKSKDSRLHPTRQAVLEGIGVFGQIHPDLAEKSGLPDDTVLAEIDLSALATKATGEVHYRPVHRHPAARRDIAIDVSKDVPYSRIQDAVAKACGDNLEKQWMFDIYEGKGIEPGRHSLSIALQFRKAGTFTDEEANQVRDAAVAALEQLGARQR